MIRPRDGREAIAVTPAAMGWAHLGFRVVRLAPGEAIDVDTAGVETAVVGMAGAGVATVDGTEHALSRHGVFEEAGGLLYVAPGAATRLRAESAWTVALGTAPADGRYPTRMVPADAVRAEIRGGGTARRQVNHLLAPPLEAERLIVFEVFVPAGSWAGWPPHRHDGEEGSPYLEETYLFRFDRPGGFGFHRNYSGDGAYDETFAVGDMECVAVPRGFHVTTAAPGHNMWILNFLAGTPVGDERARPPHFDPATTWIADGWSKAPIDLPVRAR
ncbi:5-deoxy-glucuronate isomerase [Baekduia sp.]|uniref:5-deoxy-glucuronate isomerase n=1 Tax=Baekduia sp. TaxID=2600305 RepID=UPI002D76BA5D|nr:5-deoxy-glucuronate isomerase [Baekduia sp.]